MDYTKFIATTTRTQIVNFFENGSIILDEQKFVFFPMMITAALSFLWKKSPILAGLSLISFASAENYV